jgi:predicted DNA-binding protein
MKKRVYNFNLPDELRDYLKKESNRKGTTISNYLRGLIDKDREEMEELLIFKERTVEGDIVASVANKVLLEYSFESEIEIKDVENVILNRLNRLVNMECKIELQKIERGISGAIYFKSEDMQNPGCIHVTMIGAIKSYLN